MRALRVVKALFLILLYSTFANIMSMLIRRHYVLVTDNVLTLENSRISRIFIYDKGMYYIKDGSILERITMQSHVIPLTISVKYFVSMVKATNKQ